MKGPEVTFRSEDPAKDLADLCYIANNYNEAVKKFDLEHGENNKNRKKYWRDALEKWFTDHMKIEDEQKPVDDIVHRLDPSQ